MEEPRVGRWMLLEPLARGGMGETWRAVGRRGMHAVVKFVRPGLSGRPVLERFALERRVLEHLRGRVWCVPRLLEAGEHDGAPFLALEAIDGAPIGRFLAERAASIELRYAYAYHCALLVGQVHAQGVIHGDVKPSNVLVDRRGVPILIDFGLAQLAGDPPRLGDDARLMSPRYAAPEQFRGEALTPATDVFALGATLHELLSGSHPRPSAASWRELEQSAFEGRSPPPTPCGERVDALLARAVRSSPSERFRDAAHLAAALLAAVGG